MHSKIAAERKAPTTTIATRFVIAILVSLGYIIVWQRQVNPNMKELTAKAMSQKPTLPASETGFRKPTV